MLLPPSVAPVFISYRRADARHVAARLRDSLTGFDHRVWFDIDDVPSAVPYRTQITTALRECEVAVVLIGPQWLTIVDAQGRRWRVPHNLYRVKDHGDDFTLGTPHVLRVAELAAADRAVYRYVRRVFSPKFSPIDSANVWTQILPEVRRTPVWQELAARAEAEETRASARTKAGHAARKGGSATPSGTPDFFVPNDRDEAATPAEVNDSAAVAIPEREVTSVASINTGSGVDVARTNRGSRSRGRSDVGASNSGDPTSVEPTNTTYDESRTTTKRASKDEKAKTTNLAPAQASGTMVSDSGRVTTGGPGAQPPMDAAAASTASS